MSRRFINSHWRRIISEKIESGELASEDDAIVFREIEISFNRPPKIPRLDSHLAARFNNLSRTYFQRLIKEGEVSVNNRRAKPGHSLRRTDIIRLRLPEMPDRIIKPEPIPLDIIYEDDDILLINKTTGIICHPGRGNQSGTIANAVINHILGGRPNTQNTNPGIVHRLDKNTTGIMVLAKNPYAHHHICRQFMSRRVDKVYLALVEGAPRKDAGLIEKPIGFHPRTRQLMTCAPDGINMKEARTEYEVAEKFSGCTLLAVKLHTGRTHQIRVHFQSIDHPIVGDPAYNSEVNFDEGLSPGSNSLIGRQALHAWKLTVTHPATKRKRTFEAPLPADFQTLLRTLPQWATPTRK